MSPTKPTGKIDLRLSMLSRPDFFLWLDSRVDGAYLTRIPSAGSSIFMVNNAVTLRIYNAITTFDRQKLDQHVGPSFFSHLSKVWDDVSDFIHESRFGSNIRVSAITARTIPVGDIVRRLVLKTAAAIWECTYANLFDSVLIFRNAKYGSHADRYDEEHSLTIEVAFVHPHGMSTQCAAAQACRFTLISHLGPASPAGHVWWSENGSNEEAGKVIFRYHKDHYLKEMCTALANCVVEKNTETLFVYAPLNMLSLNPGNGQIEACWLDAVTGRYHAAENDFLNARLTRSSGACAPIRKPLMISFRRSDILSLLNNPED